MQDNLERDWERIALAFFAEKLEVKEAAHQLAEMLEKLLADTYAKASFGIRLDCEKTIKDFRTKYPKPKTSTKLDQLIKF